MKKIFYLLTIISLFGISTFSQSGWTEQNSGTNNDLFAIYFLNENTGWAAGKEGTLIKLRMAEQLGIQLLQTPMLGSNQFFFLMRTLVGL